MRVLGSHELNFINELLGKELYFSSRALVNGEEKSALIQLIEDLVKDEIYLIENGEYNYRTEQEKNFELQIAKFTLEKIASWEKEGEQDNDRTSE